MWKEIRADTENKVGPNLRVSAAVKSHTPSLSAILYWDKLSCSRHKSKKDSPLALSHPSLFFFPIPLSHSHPSFDDSLVDEDDIDNDSDDYNNDDNDDGNNNDDNDDDNDNNDDRLTEAAAEVDRSDGRVWAFGRFQPLGSSINNVAECWARPDEELTRVQIAEMLGWEGQWAGPNGGCLGYFRN